MSHFDSGLPSFDQGFVYSLANGLSESTDERLTIRPV